MRRGVCLVAVAGSAALVASFALGARHALADDVARAVDPGPRAQSVASHPLNGLTPSQLWLFNLGNAEFAESELVADGLGPTMNLDNCAGCHAQPSVGGSSAAANPQVALSRFATNGQPAGLPSFVVASGPIRVARFIRNADGSPDGQVHAIFTVADRPDAAGCVLPLPNFDREVASQNVAFRIPTPVYGAGLIDEIPDRSILESAERNRARNDELGIHGRPNIIGTDGLGTADRGSAGSDRGIGRFGWKAQNTSLLVAGAEAYNQEMGITNELYPSERSQATSCPYVTTANDGSVADDLPPIDVVRRYRNTLGHRYPLTVENLKVRLQAFLRRHPAGHAYMDSTDDPSLVETAGSIERFAVFMRFLAPPPTSTAVPGGAPSIDRGKAAFAAVGCSACHTPSFQTGDAKDAVLRQRAVNLYSDLLLHDMGPDLADGIVQGNAGPRDFRTAPLWGVGQRLFFLHDGRAPDLLAAIELHASGGRDHGGSEAGRVIDQFNALSEHEKQDLLNFLRSL